MKSRHSPRLSNTSCRALRALGVSGAPGEQELRTLAHRDLTGLVGLGSYHLDEIHRYAAWFEVELGAQPHVPGPWVHEGERLGLGRSKGHHHRWRHRDGGLLLEAHVPHDQPVPRWLPSPATLTQRLPEAEVLPRAAYRHSGMLIASETDRLWARYLDRLLVPWRYAYEPRPHFVLELTPQVVLHTGYLPCLEPGLALSREDGLQQDLHAWTQLHHPDAISLFAWGYPGAWESDGVPERLRDVTSWRAPGAAPQRGYRPTLCPGCGRVGFSATGEAAEACGKACPHSAMAARPARLGSIHARLREAEVWATAGTL